MPLVWIKERPEPTAVPEGKELYPLISPVQVLSLSTIPSFLFSKIILLPVGLSISSNSFLPIDNSPYANIGFCQLPIEKYFWYIQALTQ